MPDTLTAHQRQTRAGRQALADQFPTPEARTEHYRALGRRSAERRLVLSGEEAAALIGQAEALGEAYRLLASIAERARAKAADSPEPSAA